MARSFGEQGSENRGTPAQRFHQCAVAGRIARNIFDCDHALFHQCRHRRRRFRKRDFHRPDVQVFGLSGCGSDKTLKLVVELEEMALAGFGEALALNHNPVNDVFKVEALGDDLVHFLQCDEVFGKLVGLFAKLGIDDGDSENFRQSMQKFLLGNGNTPWSPCLPVQEIPGYDCRSEWDRVPKIAVPPFAGLPPWAPCPIAACPRKASPAMACCWSVILVAAFLQHGDDIPAQSAINSFGQSLRRRPQAEHSGSPFRETLESLPGMSSGWS